MRTLIVTEFITLDDVAALKQGDGARSSSTAVPGSRGASLPRAWSTAITCSSSR